MNWLGDAITAKLQREQEAKDGEVLAIILNPPPERIIYSDLLGRGEAFELPPAQFADGLPRLIVRRGQHLALETLERYGAR